MTAGTTTRQAGPSEALSMLATRPVRAPPCLTRALSFARCHSPLAHATARTATERSDWAPKPGRVPKSTAKERKLRQPGRDRGSSRTSVFAGIRPLLERFCSTTENRGVPGSSPGLAMLQTRMSARFSRKKAGGSWPRDWDTGEDTGRSTEPARTVAFQSCGGITPSFETKGT